MGRMSFFLTGIPSMAKPGQNLNCGIHRSVSTVGQVYIWPCITYT